MEPPRISSRFTRPCQVTCSCGSGVPVHDDAFKKMFSHPLMIELLVRGHAPEWGGRIDYSTLEQLSPELVSESLQRRYPDMSWLSCSDVPRREYIDWYPGGRPRNWR